MRPLPKKIEVIDEALAEVYRAMTPEKRMQIVNNMYISAREMLLSHLRSENPAWSDEQVKREAVRRLSHGAV